MSSLNTPTENIFIKHIRSCKLNFHKPKSNQWAPYFPQEAHKIIQVDAGISENNQGQENQNVSKEKELQ